MEGKMTEPTKPTPPTPNVQSAPPAKPLSQEERKARYEKYRKAAASSRFAVKGIPGTHYFWAPKDDSSEMTRLDIIGYRITREPKAADVLAGKEKPSITASGLRQDGTYVIGDVILAECPEEIYEFALMDIEERHEAMKRAAKENFLTEAEKAGVPTFTFSK
jgi:hypothetical protein